jgi:dTDP-glucose 4,6-dehydratase
VKFEKIGVFGGAGFIGSHFVDQLIIEKDLKEVRIFDKLTYAGDLKNLKAAFEDKRVKFYLSDISNPSSYENDIKELDAIINFAAESHVDRSIDFPDIFVSTNTLGASLLASSAMRQKVGCFIQVSTDEVYGPILKGESNENYPVNPKSPYAATKAAAEQIILSFWSTFNFPVIVTRGCNTFGPRQFPEKLIPKAINCFKQGKHVPVYGSGNQIREWIYVVDHVTALIKILKDGKPGNIYNVGSGERATNLEIIHFISDVIDSDSSLIEHVTDRKGHDFRYALNSNKIMMDLNWVPAHKLFTELKNCKNW